MKSDPRNREAGPEPNREEHADRKIRAILSWPKTSYLIMLVWLSLAGFESLFQVTACGPLSPYPTQWVCNVIAANSTPNSPLLQTAYSWHSTATTREWLTL